MTQNEIDRILGKLVRDVESSVHSLYRGEVRQTTAQAHTAQLLHDACLAVNGAGPEATRSNAATARTPTPQSGAPRRHSGGAPMQAGAAYGWTADDSDAVLKCIMSWLPLGAPSAAAPDSRCIAAGRVLVPTWGERERARAAVKRISDD